jgi:DNA repair protein SbcC/Rad50
MIPLQLRVRNFMCYRDNVPPLDFSGIHLACLTGPNGHGKSALLDAMTWAVWGKARAKRDDELIHLGQSDMEVEFTFDLGGTVYRVLRKRDSSKGGRSVLDFQVADGDAFRSIGEPTIRGTQAAIDRLLRMDYDTFTNSAFLLQGRADAFTVRTAAERKQVLGEILGLGLYDEYEQRAKERVRDTERLAAEVEGMLRDIDRDLARQPEYEAEQVQAEAEVARLSGAVKEAEAALQTLRRELQMLEQQKAQLRDLDKRLAQREQELAEAESKIQAGRQQLELYEQTLAERPQIEKGYADLAAARQAEGGWNERLAGVVRVQERQRELERAVDGARRELDLDLGRLRERAGELERRARELPAHERDITVVRARLAELAEHQAERDQAQTQIQELNHEATALKVRNDQLRIEMDALKDKIDLLEREATEAQCPLCGQTLSEAHRDQLLTQFQGDGRSQGDAYRANQARRDEIAAAIERLQARSRELDRELADLVAQQRREAQLEQALSDAQRAAGDLEGVRHELELIDQRLAGDDYAAAERAKLAQLAAELEALGYDAAAHQQAREQAAALAPYEAAYQRLQTAQERRDQERTGLEEWQARRARWQEAVAEDRTRRDLLAADADRLPGVQAEAESRAREVEDLQTQSSRARLALGAAQQKLEHCRYQAVERERHMARRQKLAEEKAAFEELRLAFGKKGIQAMIIEAVIPEIEVEANRLLARMTGGRMNVRFETQRELQSGDMAETLEIKISDELGTRDYALYSGGEAFRVNFAIRIALSKLLARRAGAQLQMLVIDEGFGTQDAEGRERLVEAINSIQDDFVRILVVTHIEELRDQFPAHIEVIKTAEGSQVTIS